jgi:PTH1 family peptidyl-tRNA hydrolase
VEDDGRFVVVGLGNPGPRYETSRHNLGVMVLEILLARTNARLKSHKSGCLVADASLGGQAVALARPTSYMNESGRPLGQLVRWYKAPPERVLVIHDELDIPFGDVRVKVGGGVAGHNGLKSVAAHLRTKDFPRVRVGVSRPPGRQDPADYVLSNFSSTERKELPAILERAADAVEQVVAEGVERAMNVHNTRT